MNMDYIERMPSTETVKAELPLTNEQIEQKLARDKELADIFSGKSNKFVLIIGPCSADSSEPVLEYISRLKKVQEKVSDKIFIVPRIYTNKPRTTGEGYKGMLHQPDARQAKEDPVNGLMAIRKLHYDALAQFGLSSADEMLYPDNYRYLDDLISYVAVGARSVENQQHRMTASGLDVPVGMKNPTEGDMNIMINSIKAAQKSHSFIYSRWAVKSAGNQFAHAILRGYTLSGGINVSNYHYEDLMNVSQLYNKQDLVNRAVIVDTNHANSHKKYLEQIRIAKDVMYSRKQSNELHSLVKGLMIESYLEDGAQTLGKDAYCFGKSITDPCLGWDKTEKLIYDIAENV